jgi:hypothetical protein
VNNIYKNIVTSPEVKRMAMKHIKIDNNASKKNARKQTTTKFPKPDKRQTVKVLPNKRTNKKNNHICP